jgi:hypothetical protein
MQAQQSRVENRKKHRLRVFRATFDCVRGSRHNRSGQVSGMSRKLDIELNSAFAPGFAMKFNHEPI